MQTTVLNIYLLLCYDASLLAGKQAGHVHKNVRCRAEARNPSSPENFQIETLQKLQPWS